ncbi:MAG: cytidine deaminase [Christensenellaceae bacterium]|jgi:cytidine deaminase|nr:cytidine deaminase [Christensenellaceae bacterium]
MNKELIIKLIERARSFSENAYCPYTNVAVGCSLLVEDNVIFGGCNIENGVLSSSVDAGEVAVFKAISEGHTKFLAICFWSETRLPYPSGRVRQLLSEFNSDTNIVVANDETYAMQKLTDIYPFPPENNVE